MRPFEQRVGDVIDEELCQRGLYLSELPDPVAEAIIRIKTRLAADMESVYQSSQTSLAAIGALPSTNLTANQT